MKEYLVKIDNNWKYVEGIFHSDKYIEIPEGSEFAAVNDIDFLEFRKDTSYFSNGDWVRGSWDIDDFEKQGVWNIVWKREQETVNRINRNEFNPLVPQEGGDHYKLRPIQPIEYSERNGLSMSQGNIVKYITRHKEKNGVEDLAKVVHYALLEAYFVYDVKGSTELKQRILKMLGESN